MGLGMKEGAEYGGWGVWRIGQSVEDEWGRVWRMDGAKYGGWGRVWRIGPRCLTMPAEREGGRRPRRPLDNTSTYTVIIGNYLNCSQNMPEFFIRFRSVFSCFFLFFFCSLGQFFL